MIAATTSLLVPIGYLGFGILVCVALWQCAMNAADVRRSRYVEFEDVARSTSDTTLGSGVPDAERGASSEHGSIAALPGAAPTDGSTRTSPALRAERRPAEVAP